MFICACALRDKDVPRASIGIYPTLTDPPIPTATGNGLISTDGIFPSVSSHIISPSASYFFHGLLIHARKQAPVHGIRGPPLTTEELTSPTHIMKAFALLVLFVGATVAKCKFWETSMLTWQCNCWRIYTNILDEYRRCLLTSYYFLAVRMLCICLIIVKSPMNDILVL